MKKAQTYRTYRLAVFTDRDGRYFLTNNLRRALSRARKLRASGELPAIYAGEFGDTGQFPVQYGQAEEIKEVAVR